MFCDFLVPHAFEICKCPSRNCKQWQTDCHFRWHSVLAVPIWGTNNSDPKPGKNIIFIKWNAEVTTSSLTLMIYLVLVSWVPFLVYPSSPVPSKIQHALAGYSKFHCFRSLANERTTSFGPGHQATSDSVESAEQWPKTLVNCTGLMGTMQWLQWVIVRIRILPSEVWEKECNKRFEHFISKS